MYILILTFIFGKEERILLVLRKKKPGIPVGENRDSVELNMGIGNVYYN